MKNLSIEDPVEAIHLGSLIAAQGYIFPISDHVLTMKDDGTFYRFQAPYFWPSNCWEPENTDYAIYLCKRTMQNKARLELADYEAENLARLQRAFARKWEFIFMQAEAQVKIDRKKDKTERKILDSQERAFWDVHRPVPGCVNTTEMDIRKCRRLKNPQKVKKSVYGVTEESQAQSPVHVLSQPIRKTTKEDIRKQITFLNTQIDRHCLKMSKVAESLIAYTEQYMEYDPLITPAEPSNPWISDDVALWDIEMSKEPSQQRVKRWGFSFDEILKDQVGRDQFLRFLESEFSSENLRFWLAVQDLKKQPLQDVAKRVEEIWQEFLAPGAPSAINLDSHSYEITSQNVKDGGRYTFEDAQEHIYKLMKSDSYARFLRSNAYQDLLLAKKKPESEQGRRTSLEKFTRSVNVQNTRPVGASSVFMAGLMAMWLRTPRSCQGLSEARPLGPPSLHDGLREGQSLPQSCPGSSGTAAEGPRERASNGRCLTRGQHCQCQGQGEETLLCLWSRLESSKRSQRASNLRTSQAKKKRQTVKQGPKAWP
uniref:Regulator of G protein signaling 6 n=1 Tax=Papio anubis TaxID=9555 RepID=A0A2I3NAB1_PAPAN